MNKEEIIKNINDVIDSYRGPNEKTNELVNYLAFLRDLVELELRDKKTI